MKPHHLYIILTLLILSVIPSSQASLSAPGTWHPGHKLSGSFWDMWGENGLRNGTLGGVGNNVTFLDGSGITFLPISGTASDLDMNGKNITNVRVVNTTQVNVTTFNATNMAGNGSGISDLNASNLTSQPWVNKSGDTMTNNLYVPELYGVANSLYIGYSAAMPQFLLAPNANGNSGYITSNSQKLLFPIQQSTRVFASGGIFFNTTENKLNVGGGSNWETIGNITKCQGNMTCTYQANSSVSLDATSNTTAIFNRVLNTSTVTAGVYPNGSVELTSTGGVSQAQVNNSINWYIPKVSIPEVQILLTLDDTSKNRTIRNTDNYSLVSTNELDTFNFNTFTERDPDSVITVTSTKVNMVNGVGGASNVYTTLPLTGDFNYTFEFFVSALPSSSAAGFFIADANTNPNTVASWGSTNGVGVWWGNELFIRPTKIVNGVQTDGIGISFLLNTLYYIEVRRIGTILTVAVFLDANRTTPVVGSPQSLTVASTQFQVLNVANEYTAYSETRSYYIQNLKNGSTLSGNIKSTQGSIANPIYYKSIKLNISNGTSTSSSPVQVQIFGNADNYTAALHSTNFTLSTTDPKIVFARIYNPNTSSDYSTTLTAGVTGQTEYNLTVAGGLPPLNSSAHDTILATQIGVASIVQIDRSNTGTFTDTTLLNDGDYTVDYSTRTATKINLTTGAGIVSGSKLRVSWIADLVHANSTSQNTALIFNIIFNRNNAALEISPSVNPLTIGDNKYIELIVIGAGINYNSSQSVIIQNNNVTTARSLNTQYTNSNSKSMIVTATVRCQTTSAGGQCFFWGDNKGVPLSAHVGIESGLLNEDVTGTSFTIVPPNTVYAVNTSTSSGTATLKYWYETLI